MVTALYRRYRPEKFSEMIGQEHVTNPIMTALKTDRVNHAYLFSGPRGCGKTTSARVLARCLNCHNGPTDNPCGECPSCTDLSRMGGGSMDVVEIDAASHGGVDDAREIRERAIFAPSRDKYKIFIIDEAHMVTTGGFNALLKIVEEPPPHIKFIFATTEPEKVIGTIRSRTHHYPFRLVAPVEMLKYVQKMCEQENIVTDPGVLALVVRAGGGSVRDTLSLLDQLMAGAENNKITYERSVSLLGFTHNELLNEVIDALSVQNNAAAFMAIDKVIQTGQDPRRFLEDLLERLRDLIVLLASGLDQAQHVLRDIPEEQLETMEKQAEVFGKKQLIKVAEYAHSALNDMHGAVSPKIHLELMIAKSLITQTNDSGVRVERKERAHNVIKSDAAHPTPEKKPELADISNISEPKREKEHTQTHAIQETQTQNKMIINFSSISASWQEILDTLLRKDRRAWLACYSIIVLDANRDLITLGFKNEQEMQNFKQQSANEDLAEKLRESIKVVTGVTVKFIAKIANETEVNKFNKIYHEIHATNNSDNTVRISEIINDEITSENEIIPKSEKSVPADGVEHEITPTAEQESQIEKKYYDTKLENEEKPKLVRYGEAVVREMLGAEFIKEERKEN